jgi:hypothetical protein
MLHAGFGPMIGDDDRSGSGADRRDEVHWRADIDALMFAVPERSAWCAVHRLALRTLLGFEPSADDCLAYFQATAPAFRAAAAAKIANRQVAAGANFHLTSRDIARQMIVSIPSGSGETA